MFLFAAAPVFAAESLPSVWALRPDKMEFPKRVDQNPFGRRINLIATEEKKDAGGQEDANAASAAKTVAKVDESIENCVATLLTGVVIGTDEMPTTLAFSGLGVFRVGEAIPVPSCDRVVRISSVGHDAIVFEIDEVASRRKRPVKLPGFFAKKAR